MSKPFSDWPEIMTPEDLKQCCGFGHVEAYRIFKQKGFPLIDPEIKRCKRIGKFALRAWLNKGAIPDNYGTKMTDAEIERLKKW